MYEFEPNKVYRFISRADDATSTGRALNALSYSTPAALTNVCLYDNTPDDECQQWIYKETSQGNYFVCKANPALALDQYTGSSSTSGVTNYNAHLYSPSETSYIIPHYIRDDNDNVLYVRLQLDADRTKYLTANEGSRGSAAGTNVNAPGNVYWYKTEGVTPMSQDWIPICLDDETDPPNPGEGNPYAALNWSYVFEDETNCFGNFCYDTSGVIPPEYHKHMGIDVICPTGTEILAPADGMVYAVGGASFQCPEKPNEDFSGTGPHGSMGYFVVLKMDDLDPITGRAMYVRFLHMNNIPNLSYQDRVSVGDLLGYVGNTGASNTPHLHLDVNTMTYGQYWGDFMTADNTINPVNFFPGINFPSTYFVEGFYGE